VVFRRPGKVTGRDSTGATGSRGGLGEGRRPSRSTDPMGARLVPVQRPWSNRDLAGGGWRLREMAPQAEAMGRRWGGLITRPRACQV